MPDRPMFQRSPDSMGERPFYRMPVPSESKLAEADLKSIEALHAEQKQISEKIMAVRHTLSLLEVEMRDAQKELYELQQARRRNIAELTYVERHHRYHTFSGVRPIPEDATLLGPSDYRIIARDDQDKPDTESSPGKEPSSEASDKVVIERPKFANTHSKKAVVKENPSIKQEEKLAEKEANESTTLIIEDTAVLKPAEGSLVQLLCLPKRLAIQKVQQTPCNLIKMTSLYQFAQNYTGGQTLVRGWLNNKKSQGLRRSLDCQTGGCEQIIQARSEATSSGYKFRQQRLLEEF
ncbi:unnamed protein product [Nesidiocoris tenuis]|uniref:Uncharacterized protein n=1 Tax=Nesidiocoris tenuis TaxID=355587 RepID=A0A6H5G8S0_9HEMI|nr:unnamed protein product [Nesidiocoris tenuis]